MSPAGSEFFGILKKEARFLIIRHGQSEGNARRVFQGRLDLPLDEVGRAQARAAGAWLAREGVDAILSSPLARAAETASIAAQACGLEPELDPLLAEIGTGIFTGLSFDESKARHPDVFAAFESRSWDAVPEAEGSAELYERAMAAWALLRGRALEGRTAIACFSHGGFIQWLIRATFGCASWMPLFSTANCGVFELIAEPTPEPGAGVGGPASPGGARAYLQWRRMNYQVPPDSGA